MIKIRAAAIGGLLLWLGVIGLLVLRVDVWFNVHSDHFFLAFLGVVTWIIGLPIALSLWLRALYLEQQRKGTPER